MRLHTVLFITLLAGCASTPKVKQYDAIKPYMTRDQVYALIGRPDEVLSGDEYKVRIGYNDSLMTPEVFILKSSSLAFPASVEIWHRDQGREGEFRIYYNRRGTVRGRWTAP
jgi:hypothetical protein